MRTLEEVKEYFASDQFAKLTGVELIEVGPGYARSRLQIRPDHLNCTGHVMGGVYFTMADLTFSAAANLDPEEVRIALSAQIDFISSVTEGVLFCESRVQKKGGHISFMHTEVRDEAGKLIASVASHSYKVV